MIKLRRIVVDTTESRPNIPGAIRPDRRPDSNGLILKGYSKYWLPVVMLAVGVAALASPSMIAVLLSLFLSNGGREEG